MIRPKANEMPSRSAPVTAGVLLPARTSVATTLPGPTRTRGAGPRRSATTRWGRECSTALSYLLTCIRQCRMRFGRKLPRQEARVKRNRRSGLRADPEALGGGHPRHPGDLAVALDDRDAAAGLARHLPIGEEVLQRARMPAHAERRHPIALAPRADDERAAPGQHAVTRLGGRHRRAHRPGAE